MSTIILYSTNCPKCKVLEMKLKMKKINFSTVTELSEVIQVGENHNIASAPILQVDDNFYDFKTANTFINNYQGE